MLEASVRRSQSTGAQTLNLAVLGGKHGRIEAVIAKAVLLSAHSCPATVDQKFTWLLNTVRMMCLNAKHAHMRL